MKNKKLNLLVILLTVNSMASALDYTHGVIGACSLFAGGSVVAAWNSRNRGNDDAPVILNASTANLKTVIDNLTPPRWTTTDLGNPTAISFFRKDLEHKANECKSLHETVATEIKNTNARLCEIAKELDECISKYCPNYKCTKFIDRKKPLLEYNTELNVIAYLLSLKKDEIIVAEKELEEAIKKAAEQPQVPDNTSTANPADTNPRDQGDETE